MEFEIRRAAIEDAEAMATVHVESWRSTYAGIVPEAFLNSLDVGKRAEKWREHFLAGGMLAFVAEDRSGISGSSIFGFISGGKLREAIDGYDAELYAVYLLPDDQRRGAGRCLARSLVKALRIEGFKSLAVWVLEQNHSGVSFYRRLGGVPIARKTIDIGGTELWELAYGWPALESLLK